MNCRDLNANAVNCRLTVSELPLIFRKRDNRAQYLFHELIELIFRKYPRANTCDDSRMVFGEQPDEIIGKQVVERDHPLLAGQAERPAVQNQPDAVIFVYKQRFRAEALRPTSILKRRSDIY